LLLLSQSDAAARKAIKLLLLPLCLLVQSFLFVFSADFFALPFSTATHNQTPMLRPEPAWLAVPAVLILRFFLGFFLSVTAAVV
jgi:hypothetical protein